ncbi:RING finger protein 37 [Patella vulgata]|uniref:RING finger protein 37 n=1 Tax=Patella vulgata TaxID=6465 RepID=UPI00217FC9FF|nr:RING finger protein 37 [Patella vulgata]
MVLINFCHWSTKTNISCDKISSDGYEVENLISSDPSKKRKGYLAERFIKLPINITFHFPCPISIWRIVIDPVVGSQKSSSIGVFAPASDTAPAQKEASQEKQNNISKSSELSNTIQPRTFSGRSMETFVSRISMTSPGKMCFYDSQFRARKPYSAEGFNSLDHYSFVSELRHIRQVYCTRNITIRIYQTFHGSVGAIKSIEIWGQPLASCPKDFQNNLYKVYMEQTNLIRPNHIFPNSDNFSTTDKDDVVITDVSNSSNLYPERRKIQDVDIPEDFVDPISCEIMVIPMLLPCGRNIDKSTLDRFVSIEETWGRAPSDPFTNVLFNSDSYPIPNDGLKGRIDQFLFSNKNSVKLQSVPRTVATIYQKQKPCKRKQPLNNHADSGDQHSNNELNGSMPKKISLRVNENILGRSNLTASPTLTTNSKKYEIISTQETRTIGNSHEQLLQNSLDSALSNVLGSFPSFTKGKSTSEYSELELKCSHCKLELSEDVVQYKLPCTHIICRGCLTKTNIKRTSILCQTCGTTSEKKLIERQHPNS